MISVFTLFHNSGIFKLKHYVVGIYIGHGKITKFYKFCESCSQRLIMRGIKSFTVAFKGKQFHCLMTVEYTN